VQATARVAKKAGRAIRLERSEWTIVNRAPWTERQRADQLDLDRVAIEI